jgi:hypothetical protein
MVPTLRNLRNELMAQDTSVALRKPRLDKFSNAPVLNAQKHFRHFVCNTKLYFKTGRG